MVAGIDYETFSADNTRSAGNGFPSPQFTYLVSAAQYTNASQEVTNSRLLSYYTRANFSWRDKYVVTTTLRADGSSKFGANNRYGFFPSVSLGWKLAKEPFLAKLSIINDLKLRASFGQTGNQAGIGDFAARGLSLGGNNYQGQPGVNPGTLDNTDLRWETTNEYNLGLDFALWNDRLNGSFDFYVKNTKDLLLNRPIPPTSGFSGFDQNVGRMSNKGVELGVNSLLIDRGLQWSLGFQVAANKNKVVELYDGQGYNTSPFLPIRVDEGQPLGYFYGWKSLGVNPETGDLMFEDLNQDGRINEADNQFIGSPHPDFMGAAFTNLSFRGIYLDIFFNFVQGNEVLHYTRSS